MSTFLLHPKNIAHHQESQDANWYSRCENQCVCVPQNAKNWSTTKSIYTTLGNISKRLHLTTKVLAYLYLLLPIHNVQELETSKLSIN